MIGEDMGNAKWVAHEEKNWALYQGTRPGSCHGTEKLSQMREQAAALPAEPESPLDAELGELGAALMEVHGNVFLLAARLTRVLDVERQLPSEAEKAPPAPCGALCETLRDKTEQTKQISRELSRILGQLVL